MLTIGQLCTQLIHQGEIISSLTRDITSEQARWKPTDQDWSVLEVINHLCDEESQDFQTHLAYALHHSENEPWPTIDPQGWVSQRQYNQQSWDVSRQRLIEARQASIRWLYGLTDVNWQKWCTTPWGTITAGDLAASWLAHDLLHTRQLVELRWAWNTQAVQPYKVAYAGDW